MNERNTSLDADYIGDEINIGNLTFKLTCAACPEQYDVTDSDGKQVAYVRLRWGRLTVQCPDVGGALVYDYSFEDDDLKGRFDSVDEREVFLVNSAARINRWIKEFKL